MVRILPLSTQGLSNIIKLDQESGFTVKEFQDLEMAQSMAQLF